jgi:DNA-binding NarL/FixJ family response regulator
MARPTPEFEEHLRPSHPGPTAPAPEGGAPLDLSEREQQIAELLVEGLTNKEIAERLFLSTETIKSYVARILRKLGARNRVQAAVLLARGGIVPSTPPGRDGTS